MKPISKIRITGVVLAIAFTLALSLTEGRANAQSVATCNVKAVSFQQATGSPGEALVLYCNDNSFYMGFIGPTSPSTFTCNMSIGSAQGIQSLALAARMAGKPLSVTYLPKTCTGKTVNIIASVQL